MAQHHPTPIVMRGKGRVSSIMTMSQIKESTVVYESYVLPGLNSDG